MGFPLADQLATHLLANEKFLTNSGVLNMINNDIVLGYLSIYHSFNDKYKQEINKPVNV